MRTTLLLGQKPLWNTPEPGAGSAEPDPAPAPASGEPAPAANTAVEQAPDLSFIPETYVVDGKPDLAKFRDDYTASMAELAQLREARTGVPETPDAYEFTVPDLDLGDVKLPEGYKFEIDKDDPALADMRQWLHANGIKADAVPGLMGVYAKMEAMRAAQHQAHIESEVQALGGTTAFEGRISKLESNLTNKIGAEGAKELLSATYTAGAVRALEKLLGTGGGMSTRQEPAKVTVDETLPASERLRLLRTAG